LPHKYMIRPEHPFDIRPDLRKAETTKVGANYQAVLENGLH
jgi:hypothetical protein